MSRIFLIFSLLFNYGCVILKQPKVEFSAFSADLECPSGQVRLALSVDKSGILLCECDGNDVEMVGMNVRLFALEKGEFRIPDAGMIKLKDNVRSVLYNPETGSLWISRICLSAFPYYATSVCEGGASGGFVHTERHFDPQVKIPNDVNDYTCVDCEILVKVRDVVKTVDARLFQLGTDMKEVKGLRRMYYTEDESGCGWH